MILRSRAFQRREPSRDAKLFIIYCEGSRREPDYFRYFSEISSNIRLEVVEADSQGNNSPLGLYEAACQDLHENEMGFLSPKYQLDKDDEVWFIIDTDQWGEDIEKLRLHCESESSWGIGSRKRNDFARNQAAAVNHRNAWHERKPGRYRFYITG